jgi:transcriptional regulator with XRE-family HTH domain
MMLKDRKGTGLTNDIVSSARIRAGNGEYINEIADELGVSRGNLYNAVRNGWEHLDAPPVENPKVKRYRKANKISHEEYLEILEALKTPYWGQGNFLAKKYGVNHTMISHIKHGRFATSAISVHE